MTINKRHIAFNREVRRNWCVSYTYNVRGWTTSIVSPPFKQYLHYQDTYGTATPCWNGNISAMEWESLDALLATQPARHSYAYTYDGLNRLTAAAHEAVDYDEWSDRLMMSNEPDYSCTYGYDLNGNMTSLTRHGVNVKVNVFNNDAWHFGEIDHLSMTYDGNRLQKATDQCAELTYAGAMDFKDGADKQEEYLWDANGNMTRDRNKDIYEICYNVLNLPERIRYYDGHEVRYTYAADGRKLHVDYLLNLFAIIDDEWGSDPEPQPFPSPNSTGNLLSGGDGLNGGLPGQIDPIVFEPQVLMTRDWCGGHIYKNGTIERIENEYGYWADSCYHYRITDYQGNVRAVISQNGVLEEVNAYYPYGGLLGAPAIGVQARKYGGKELDRENGLDWLDSQARMYDFIIGRTPTMDPMSEKYYHLSPYLWCAGNPVRYTDPTGCIITIDYENMTTEQVGELQSTIDLYMNRSKLFSTLYSVLNDDPNNIITIGFGVVDGEDPAQYNPKDKRITLNSSTNLASANFSEELYHSYQDIYKTLNAVEWNREYEAKVIVSLIHGEGSLPKPQYYAAVDYFDELYYESFDLGGESVFKNMNEFSHKYLNHGKSFIDGYLNYDSNYTYPIEFIPKTLYNLITKAYGF